MRPNALDDVPADALPDFERQARLNDRAEDLLQAAKGAYSIMSRPIIIDWQPGAGGHLTYLITQSQYQRVFQSMSDLIDFIEQGPAMAEPVLQLAA